MRWIQITLFLCLFYNIGFSAENNVKFMRGDTNADTFLDISDAVNILMSLFGNGGVILTCQDAADLNDGSVNIADCIYNLTYLFAQGSPPPSPFTLSPSATFGCDPTPDDLGCLSYRDNLVCGDPNPGSAIIIDHTCIDIRQVSTESVEVAKENFKLWYGHTSHGSQIMNGISLIRDDIFNYNDGADTLSIRETGGDLGNPNSTEWANKTRTQLNRADNIRSGC